MEKEGASDEILVFSKRDLLKDKDVELLLGLIKHLRTEVRRWLCWFNKLLALIPIIVVDLKITRLGLETFVHCGTMGLTNQRDIPNWK